MSLRRFKILLIITFALICGNVSAATTSVYKFDSSAVMEYARNLDSNNVHTPNFQPVCEVGNGYCVKDIFNWTNVQMIQAIALAEEYAKTKNNHKIICSPQYRKSGNDDWVQCVDETGTHFYEFKFDDVKESLDNTIKESVVSAVCQMHGGKVRDEYMQFCDNANCIAVNKSLNRFGYSAELKNIMNTPAESGCKISYGAVSGKTYALRDGNGAFTIDPKKFLKLQLQSSSDIKFFIQRYVTRQMAESGLVMKSFRCNDGFQTYYNDSIMNQKEDMLTCYVTDTANNEYTLDFLFDDANEMLNFEAKAGTSGLNCLADKGGLYDGKNCSGLDKSQCVALNSELPGGTEWNPILDTCVLKDASKAQSIKDNAKTIGKYAIGTTVLIITIASGGSTLAIVGSVAATAGAGTASHVQTQKETRVREFLAQSARCTSSMCAAPTLKTYIDETAAFYDDLKEDTQLWVALDGELARILNLLPADAEIFQDAISQAIRDSQDIRNWDSWPDEEKQSFAANAMILIGATAGLSEFAYNGWQSVVKLFKSSKAGYSSTRILTSKLNRIFNSIKESLDTAAEVAGVVDDGMDAVEVSSKIGVAMQAMM